MLKVIALSVTHDKIGRLAVAAVAYVSSTSLARRSETVDMLRYFKNGLIRVGRQLPQNVRKLLFHYAYNCAPEEFERFSYIVANAPSQRHGLAGIKLRGFSPQLIVDVGAYQGEWTRLVRSIWPQSKIVMIEPNRELSELLRSTAEELNATIITDLLGAEDGIEVEFHVMESGSSIYPERSNEPRRTESRRLATLDSVLSGYEPIDLLKIDAQGYELQILEGGKHFLDTIQAVLLEVSLIEINEGSPILDEVIAYMRSRNLVAYEILELHRRPLDGALSQVDILFVQKNGSLRSDRRFN